MAHVSYPPVFVVGMGRSGTTLLRLMMHHHPRIAIPYESGFLTTYQERHAEYGDLREKTNVRRLVDDMLREPNLQSWDHTFDAERLVAATKAPSVAGVVDAIYSEYAAAKGKARWGDKSDYLDRLHIINEMFPSALFIHIIRDGRDVAGSVLKLDWGPNDVIHAAEWWNEHVWVARRIGQFLGPQRYLEVRYESLVQESERELRRVCAFMNEDYSAEMLAYHSRAEAAIPPDKRDLHRGFNSQPDAARTFAWKREMDPVDASIFSRHAKRMLMELDYEMPDSPNRMRIALRYMSILGRRLRSKIAD
jgi:hypothetical protein